jgi:formate-dependent nitrite reductase membrane component NrfD
LSSDYGKVPESASNDGRNIDLRVAHLTGEAASQTIDPTKQPQPGRKTSWSGPPEAFAADLTYYDVPLLKEPVWEWVVPAYYYVGGVAGASFALAAAAQLIGSHELGNLVRRARWTGIVGASISGVLLIYDLGRPSRFANMLRVFRPTSPMNVGAWILTGTVPAALCADLFTRIALLRPLGRLSNLISGFLGLSLATYTGVLVSNSAIPIWYESRSYLPLLFGASGATSAGALFEIFVDEPVSARIIHNFGLIGKASELAFGYAFERRASALPRVARPLKRGASGFLWKAGVILTAASLVIDVIPRKRRMKHVVAGVLASLGSICMRFGTHAAGVASARDPRSSFRQQRSALDRRLRREQLVRLVE